MPMALRYRAGLAYVADSAFRPSRLWMSRNRTSPVLRSAYATTNIALGVAVSGGLAYVANGDYGLQIVDVSNPALPVWRGASHTTSDAQGVAILSGLAYIADGPYGLKIVDVSNPASPVLWGAYRTPSDARGVAVSGGLAYVANEADGLWILKFTGEVLFDSSSSSVSESQPTHDIKVVLHSESTNQTVTVNYSATNGTAQGDGVDYTLDSGTLTFAPGETEKTISLSLTNDSFTKTMRQSRSRFRRHRISMWESHRFTR